MQSKCCCVFERLTGQQWSYQWLGDADLCITDVLGLQVYVEHSCHPETETVQSVGCVSFKQRLINTVIPLRNIALQYNSEIYPSPEQ